MPMKMKLCSSATLGLIIGLSSSASATTIWDGGGTDNFWTNAVNWASDVAPVAGDDLIFGSTTLRQNNTNSFPAGTTFNSIKLTRAGFNLYGSNIAVTAHISMSDLSGACTVN